MGLHTVRKGLDLPISGLPVQELDQPRVVNSVALVAADYVGMRPAMAVKQGDTVRRGQLLFSDRKTLGVRFTAPGAGTVVAINRGARRALQSVVIRLNEREAFGDPADDDHQPFDSITTKAPEQLNRAEVVGLLAESGLWTALRARPYSRTPSPEAEPPFAVFVTAADTHPLAPRIELALTGREEDFQRGLKVVSKLTAGKTYVCTLEGAAVDIGDAPVEVEAFAGPHPAGTVGLHIHTLAPVHRGRTVWHLAAQDVAAIGELFRTGRLPVERVVSLAGPLAAQPRVLRTRLGASLDDLAGGDEVKQTAGETRVVSGSVLHGRQARGAIHGYLGRYHQQVSLLAEPHERTFMRMIRPGAGVYSTLKVFVGAIRHRLSPRRFPMDAAAQGSHRAMVPIGMYERVMPLDLMATHLLRAILVNDTVNAEQLGVLELDEEDLGLCTFVCPCKNDYTTALRETLATLEKEG